MFSCTVKMPDIKITGEKTTLEKQILGEYLSIEETEWMLISERGSDNINFETASNRKIIEAVRKRLFLLDEVNEYKIKGFFGEDTTGYITIVSKDKIEGILPKDLDRINLILENENSSRKVIINEVSNKYSYTETKKAFYNLNIDKSPKGTLIRNFEGKWDIK